jgi:Flp pilus assembly protein TadD
MSKVVRLHTRKRRGSTNGTGALAPFPPQAGARYDEAVRAEERGDKERATQLYRTVLRLDPFHAGARANLGVILHEAGRFVEAEATYAVMAQTDATCAFNLGVALEDQGKIDQAISAYRAAIVICPVNADAHFNLGRLLEHHKRDRAGAMRCLMTYNRLVHQQEQTRA